MDSIQNLYFVAFCVHVDNELLKLKSKFMEFINRQILYESLFHVLTFADIVIAQHLRLCLSNLM
jgi:hypothetical protein